MCYLHSVSRPLTIAELANALELLLPTNVRLAEIKVILERNRSFLVTFSTSVQFAHYVVQQYICSSDFKCPFTVKPREGHVRISNLCLSLLSDGAFSKQLSSTYFQKADLTTLVTKYPLFSYAVLNWPEHLNSAKVEIEHQLLDRLFDFVSSNNLFTIIEAALTMEGISSLQRWSIAFTELGLRLPDTIVVQNLKRFVAEFKHLILKYGNILSQFPTEIHHIINDSFPRASRFWKQFGHTEVSSCQIEEWDLLVASLTNCNINCIAVDRDHVLAPADRSGVFIIDLLSWTEITKISMVDSLVIAMTFNSDSTILAILTQDETLKIISADTWKIEKDLPGIVPLPEVVFHWNEVKFWNEFYLEFDPVHVNLNFVGKALIAMNTIVDWPSRRRKECIENVTLTSSTSNFASTALGDVIALSTDGELIKRRLGSQELTTIHSFPPFKYIETNTFQRRLLGVSARGRFPAICRNEINNGFSRSQNAFECYDSMTSLNILKGEFRDNYRITAVAFNTNESILAVAAYNPQQSLETIKLWTLGEKPLQIWERTVSNEYTTSLTFAMEDTVLIEAGRSLRVFDITLLEG